MLVSSYHVRTLAERNFFDPFSFSTRTSTSYVCANALNGRENGLTARCDCVGDNVFFVGRISRSGDMWEARQNDFQSNNASGRAVLNPCPKTGNIRRESVFFSTSWKPSYFAHFTLARIQASALNPSRLSEISKSIRNASLILTRDPGKQVPFVDFSGRRNELLLISKPTLTRHSFLIAYSAVISVISGVQLRIALAKLLLIVTDYDSVTTHFRSNSRIAM